MSTADGSRFLFIRRLSKTFPGTVALDDVDFDLRRGEVHALVGQNGSGKSTLIKVLAGYYPPDPGATVELDRVEVHLADPTASRQAGFRFVHQDLGLVETLSTVENLALGRGFETGFAGRIKWREERRTAEAEIRALGYRFDVRRSVGTLAAAEKTGVAIARALHHWEQANALVLDEPTATLPKAEVGVLFEAVRRVSARGLGVIYVSHRLDEIFDIADRVTVLRDGRRVGTYRTAELDHDRLISIMIGEEELRPPGERLEASERKTVLEARELCGAVVDGVSLTARAHEVLGIAGLTGSGREEILSLIFGATSRANTVFVDGNPVDGSPRASKKAGIALVPADRRGRGSVTTMTVMENCTLTDLGRHAPRLGILRRGSERAEAARWIESLDVRPPRPEAIFAILSGGNQQKVVMAKWLRMKPRVLLLDEPTQGIDVQAKAAIHALVREIASGGAAVVIASSDDEELADVCDRVLIMRDGAVVAEVHPQDLSVEELGRLQLA
jgi:ribose transport system ATP-binding protein